MALQMLMSPVSRAVQHRLKQHLNSKLGDFVEQLHEFDDCRYQLQGDASGGLVLSFGLPSLPDCYKDQMLNSSTNEALATVYSSIAEVVQPQPGYQLSLKIDTWLLRKIDPATQDWWIEVLASLRLYITGAPLRELFLRLARGTIRQGPVEQLCSRPGQVYFVKPRDDSVNVILPMRFVSSQDAAIGQAILQEFAEVRRTAALGLSPTCTYHTAKNPPLELQGVSPELLGSGYICFTFCQRHVTGSQLEHVVWSMTTLYTLIGYHIKACKAMIHGRMRAKLDSMLRVVPPPASTPLPALKPLHSTGVHAAQAGPLAQAALPALAEPSRRLPPGSASRPRTAGQPDKAAFTSSQFQTQVPDTQLTPDRVPAAARAR